MIMKFLYSKLVVFSFGIFRMDPHSFPLRGSDGQRGNERILSRINFNA